MWVENALGAAGRGVTGVKREISCRYPREALWPSYEDIYDNECKTLGVCTISVDDTRNNRYNFIIGRPRWLYTHEAQTNHPRYLISPIYGWLEGWGNYSYRPLSSVSGYSDVQQRQPIPLPNPLSHPPHQREVMFLVRYPLRVRLSLVRYPARRTCVGEHGVETTACQPRSSVFRKFSEKISGCLSTERKTPHPPAPAPRLLHECYTTVARMPPIPDWKAVVTLPSCTRTTHVLQTYNRTGAVLERTLRSHE